MQRPRCFHFQMALRALTALLFLFLTTYDLPLTTAFSAVEMPAASILKGLTWLGHASFRLERAGKVVYFDPWQIAGQPHDADLVLISHPHFDHLSPEDVAKVVKTGTEIVTVAEGASKLKENGITAKIHTVQPGDKVSAAGVAVEAVPAYNTDKRFHPKGSGWVGFVLELDGVRIYHAGDTDNIPEMKGIRADVALLPVSGTYVMTAAEAAEAAQAIQPRVAVPMHYGSIVGTAADAKDFKVRAGAVLVELLEKQS